MRRFLVVLSLLVVTTIATAQVPKTTTTYNIPAGQVCGGSPESCTFYPDGIVRDGFGRFQTGGFTQLVFDSYNAEDCWDPFTYASTVVWQPVADTDIVPPPLPTPPPNSTYTNQSDVKLFVMDCKATTLQGGYSLQEGHSVHAEIYAYSYLYTYSCGGRVRTTCHRTIWSTVDGSFVEDVIPSTAASSGLPPHCGTNCRCGCDTDGKTCKACATFDAKLTDILWP